MLSNVKQYQWFYPRQLNFLLSNLELQNQRWSFVTQFDWSWLLEYSVLRYVDHLPKVKQMVCVIKVHFGCQFLNYLCSFTDN